MNPHHDNPGHGHNPSHTVHIFVDDDRFEVVEGDWKVLDLKTKAGVDPAKVLAEITGRGLIDLEDDKTIRVHNNQKFMTHARTGGSS